MQTPSGEGGKTGKAASPQAAAGGGRSGGGKSGGGAGKSGGGKRGASRGGREPGDVGQMLRGAYRQTIEENIPDDLIDLLNKLE